MNLLKKKKHKQCIKVHVSQDDINAAEYSQGPKCPIARAIRASEDISLSDIHIGLRQTRFTNRVLGKSYLFENSIGIRHWIDLFDDGKKVPPLDLILDFKSNKVRCRNLTLEYNDV